MLTILFYGTLWGLMEAVLGGLMHALHFRLTGSLMMGVGAYCLLSCVMKQRKDILTRCLGVSAIAASLKLLSIPFYHKSIFSRSIGHPVVSILSEGLVAGVVLYFALKFLSQRTLTPLKLSGVYVLLGLLIGFVARSIHWAVYNVKTLPAGCVSSGGVPTIIFCGVGVWLASRSVFAIRLKRPYYLYASVFNIIAALVYYGFTGL